MLTKAELLSRQTTDLFTESSASYSKTARLDGLSPSSSSGTKGHLGPVTHGGDHFK